MSRASINNINYQDPALPVSSEIKKRKEFSDREVGLTHPDLSSFIRLNDEGDIEIFAAPGIGIIISARSKSISFFGDSVRMHTKEDGLRWNSYNFNYAASSYIEPTLVKINTKSIHSAQNGVSYYLDIAKKYDQEEKQKPITITGEYGFAPVVDQLKQNYQSEYSIDGLTNEQIGLLEIYQSDYSKEHILYMISLMKEGTFFEQAHQLALEAMNE
jgi:hypothetical protein